MWRPERLGSGAYRGKINLMARLSGDREWMGVSVALEKPSLRPGLRRLMRNLGYEDNKYSGKVCGFRRLSRHLPRSLEAERLRILAALDAGNCERRPLVPAKKLGRKDLVSSRRAKTMISFLETPQGHGWQPRSLFLRQARRFRISGYRWSVYYDGYWEPVDPERRGLELHLLMISDDIRDRRDWIRLRAEGFVSRVDEDFSKLGFEVPDRSPDWAEKRDDAPWLMFERPLWDPRRYLSEVRAMLAWAPT